MLPVVSKEKTTSTFLPSVAKLDNTAFKENNSLWHLQLSIIHRKKVKSSLAVTWKWTWCGVALCNPCIASKFWNKRVQNRMKNSINGKFNVLPLNMNFIVMKTDFLIFCEARVKKNSVTRVKHISFYSTSKTLNVLFTIHFLSF